MTTRRGVRKAERAAYKSLRATNDLLAISSGRPLTRPAGSAAGCTGGRPAGWPRSCSGTDEAADRSARTPRPA